MICSTDIIGKLGGMRTGALDPGRLGRMGTGALDPGRLGRIGAGTLGPEELGSLRSGKRVRGRDEAMCGERCKEQERRVRKITENRLSLETTFLLRSISLFSR